MHELSSLVIAAITAVPDPRPVSGIGVVRYDVVDAYRLRGATAIRVIGVISGHRTQSSVRYVFARGAQAVDGGCDDRFVLRAMARPDRYQLALVDMGAGFICQLIARPP